MLSPQEVFNNLAAKKQLLCNFVASLQKRYTPSIYLALNPTFIKNPYLSRFPQRFIFEDFTYRRSIFDRLVNTFFIWAKNLLLLIWSFLLFCLFKIKIARKVDTSGTQLLIDSFFRMDLQPDRLNCADSLYFPGLFEKIEAAGINYLFLPRLMNGSHNSKNPFQVLSLAKKLNASPEAKIVVEFDLLRPSDYLRMLFLILALPLSVHRFFQAESSRENQLFNACLVDDIKSFEFETIKRYFVARRIAKSPRLTAVLSWFENQSIDRSFNFGIREAGFSGQIIGCQLFLNFPSYINSEPEDLDHQQKTAPDKVVVNGKAYMRNLKNISYELGESLRYKRMFSFPLNSGCMRHDGVVLLASYIFEETRHMIDLINKIPGNIILKIHPTQNRAMFNGLTGKKITFAEGSLYELFEKNSLFISTASGSAMEAVACGKSVIIVGKPDTLVACPLIDIGRGEIWDIAFSDNELNLAYDKLMNKRKTEPDRIIALAAWYRKNFFVEKNEHFPLGMLESTSIRPQAHE